MKNTPEFTGLQQVCDAFDAGVLEKFENIAEGVLNLNYKLYTSKGIYFAKSVRAKRQGDIGNIYEVEKIMEQARVPAVAMLLTKEGMPFFRINEQCFTLYPFITSDRSHTYSADDYYRMGQMLARIHLVTKDVMPTHIELKVVKNNEVAATVETLFDFKNRIMSKDVQDDTDRLFLKYIDLKLSLLTDMKDSNDLAAHRPHLLHGDYHAGNLLIDKDSREIVGVCDWEKSEKGSRAYEIARSAILLFEFGSDNDLLLLSSYLGGYQEIYPISKEELIDGFVFRAKAIVKSKWMEDFYYNLGDSRSNHFVEEDIQRINFFRPILSESNNEAFFEKILKRMD